MELTRKKVLLIDLSSLLSEDNGLTDFHIRQDILDRIATLNIQYVIIITGEKSVKTKAIEFFIFSYCKVAVRVLTEEESSFEALSPVMPHNMRKRDVFLSVGRKMDNIDNITIEDFICR